MIALLDIGIWALKFLLMELFHDDEESAVQREGFIGNTEPPKEEPLIVGKTEPFHLDGLAILGTSAVYKMTEEVSDYGMDLFGNEAGAVFSGRWGLQFPDKCLGFGVHEQPLPCAREENDAGSTLLLRGLGLLVSIEGPSWVFCHGDRHVPPQSLLPVVYSSI